ncbi:hypothetical protein NCC49_004191 [Naganishia albida]|nr:hypothetical protein NCC49_004191 [Naganishia albida]
MAESSGKKRKIESGAEEDEENGGKKAVRMYASACQFCRRRKMKCDTARPSCKNCIEHGETCNYQRETKPRPTHAVIQGLQEQVAELQRQLEAQQQESRLLERKNREPSVNGHVAVEAVRIDPPLIRALSGASQPGVDGQLQEFRRASTEKALPGRNGSALQESPLATLKPIPIPSERNSPEPEPDDVHGIAHYSTSAFFDATCVPPPAEDPVAEIRSGVSAGTGSTWGVSPNQGEDAPSLDGIKPEPSDPSSQPAFRLPSDSHLRSHLEKVERGTRQRRESMVKAVPEMDAEDLVRQNELMARAAQARHCERIDFTTGVLDFDGWPPSLVRHLLELHFNRQHHAFCITYRPAFMRDMASGGPYFSKLLLNAILYGVSKYSDRQELSLPNLRGGLGFLDRAKTLLGQDLHEPSVPTIQALLLLANSLGAQGIAGNGSMLYLKIALAMITELGIDREDVKARASAETREINRRVVWAAYVIDKLQSLYQGRSYCLPLHTLHVLPEFLDLYEELEEWQPYAFPGAQTTITTTAYSVSTFQALCRLSIIIEHIIGEIYTGTTRRTKQARRTKRDELDRELRSWKQSLPPHLCFNPREPVHIPTPMIFSLHALYHTSTIILHRPFVESTEEYFSDSASTTASWSACVAAAVAFTQCLRLYRQIFTIRRAPYLISYATYVASTIHVRAVAAENAMLEKIEAQNPRGPNGTVKEPSDATKALKLCWDALVEAGKVNAGCRKAQNIIAGLMDKLGITLGVTPRVVDVPLPDNQLRRGMERDVAQDGTNSTPPFPVTTPNPAEQVDIESIMRSFWWPEPYDASMPGQSQDGADGVGSLGGYRPAPPPEYGPQTQHAATFGGTTTPSFMSSMMNTGFDPSLGAPLHQLQQPVFPHTAGFSMPPSRPHSVAVAADGAGDDFGLFGSGGATSAMLDPLIGFLHEEPFYGA